jgi:hypothetical protein
MTENNQNNGNSTSKGEINLGHQPAAIEKGHQPTTSLDTTNPPQGGSGVAMKPGAQQQPPQQPQQQTAQNSGGSSSGSSSNSSD